MLMKQGSSLMTLFAAPTESESDNDDSCDDSDSDGNNETGIIFQALPFQVSCPMSVTAGARLRWTHISCGRRLNLRDDRSWTGHACISLALESCD